MPKTQCLCGFADFTKTIKMAIYIKFTSFDARNRADEKKSHNLYNEWAIPIGVAHFSKMSGKYKSGI